MPVLSSSLRDVHSRYNQEFWRQVWRLWHDQFAGARARCPRLGQSRATQITHPVGVDRLPAMRLGVQRLVQSFCSCDQPGPIYHAATQRGYCCDPTASPRHAVIKDWPSRFAHRVALYKPTVFVIRPIWNRRRCTAARILQFARV